MTFLKLTLDKNDFFEAYTRYNGEKKNS